MRLGLLCLPDQNEEIGAPRPKPDAGCSDESQDEAAQAAPSHQNEVPSEAQINRALEHINGFTFVNHGAILREAVFQMVAQAMKLILGVRILALFTNASAGDRCPSQPAPYREKERAAAGCGAALVTTCLQARATPRQRFKTHCCVTHPPPGSL